MHILFCLLLESMVPSPTQSSFVLTASVFCSSGTNAAGPSLCQQPLPELSFDFVYPQKLTLLSAVPPASDSPIKLLPDLIAMCSTI